MRWHEIVRAGCICRWVYRAGRWASEARWLNCPAAHAEDRP